MKAKPKKLVRKLPPKKAKAVVKRSAAKPLVVPIVAVKPKKAPVLRVTADGVRLSRVQVSPEGVVLKVLD